MAAAVTFPFVPTKAIKSFGALGPKYEVGGLLRQLADGDWMVEILLVETGERTEYRLSWLTDDPGARRFYGSCSRHLSRSIRSVQVFSCRDQSRTCTPRASMLAMRSE